MILSVLKNLICSSFQGKGLKSCGFVFHRNAFKDIPKKIKQDSLNEEERITQKLYKDYSEFRRELFNDIVDKNKEYDKLTLLNKTQKLLDRFLFIYFGEDRLLIPPNSLGKILSQWSELKEKYDEYFPLYNRYKSILVI